MAFSYEVFALYYQTWISSCVSEKYVPLAPIIDMPPFHQLAHLALNVNNIIYRIDNQSG